ncbi:MAG: cytochrome c [Bacteroidetes bacterium]|nr:cytochrome c [Bacteroidota bacterium]
MKTLNVFALAFLGILSLSILSSCGGGKTSDQKGDTTQVSKAAPGAPSAEVMALGKGIYDAKCKACHQPTGLGLKPAFPPLAASDYLLADKKRAVAQALNGSQHEITVNGAVYNALMPQQVGTVDSAVAVINYVLNSFGNTGGTITADDVKDVVIDKRK